MIHVHHYFACIAEQVSGVFNIIPMSVVSIAFGVNISFRILEVSHELKAVDEQTSGLLKITEHVNRNLSEARRLRRLNPH